jgi:hypothetical protein
LYQLITDTEGEYLERLVATIKGKAVQGTIVEGSLLKNHIGIPSVRLLDRL